MENCNFGISACQIGKLQTYRTQLLLPHWSSTRRRAAELDIGNRRSEAGLSCWWGFEILRVRKRRPLGTANTERETLGDARSRPATAAGRRERERRKELR